MKVLVRVTGEHIAHGMAGSAWRCPVALALIDCGFNNVLVSRNSLDTSEQIFNVPRSAKKFMLKFDTTGFGDPFSFFLVSKNTVQAKKTHM